MSHTGRRHLENGLPLRRSLSARPPRLACIALLGLGSAWLRRVGLLVLLALTLFMATTAAMAQPDCHRTESRLTLPPNFSPTLAGQSTYLLEDPSGTLIADDVIHGCQAWHASTSQGIQPGITRSVWWAKLPLRLDPSQPGKVYLDTQDNLQDFVDITLVDSQGQVLGSWKTGDRRPFKQRPLANTSVVVPITPPADGIVDVYLRLESHDGLHEAISLKLYQDEDFIQHTQVRYAINALYTGLAIALIVYNAFMYLAARVPMVGLYSVYACTFFLWATTFYGINFQYLWPNWPNFNNNWLALSACLAHIAGFHFFTRYIGNVVPEAKAFSEKANVAIKVLLLVPTTFALFGQYLLTFVTLIPANLVMAHYITGWAAYQWWRGNVMGKYVLLAFSALAVGVILYFSKVLALVDSNVITDNGIQFGAMLEVLLVAFGVAHQFNVIQAGKITAEKNALLAQRALNVELDKLVKERTASLEEANTQLKLLSTTDALTLVHNRRSFEDDITDLLGLHATDRQAWALSLFDIDHFKWVNDHLGHHSGDQVLKAVASVAQRVADSHGARVYRFGGEEFAVVFPQGTDAQTAFDAIEEMRQAIADARIPHGGSRFGVVTASFGVIAYPTAMVIRDAPSEHPCTRADKLLYAAKHAGRNAVMSAEADMPPPSTPDPASPAPHST